MRKIIVLSFISLDGILQAPGGPQEDTSGGFRYGGWVVPFFDEALGQIMEKQMSKQSDLLLGRKTFEIFANYWPQHESEWPGINSVTKYVASNTILDHTWTNSIFLRGDIIAQIKKIKQQNGADIQVHGSGNLIQTLLNNNLIDELWLKIFPVSLGKGKRLFATGTIPAKYRLVESQITPKGIIVANYVHDGEIETGSF